MKALVLGVLLFAACGHNSSKKIGPGGKSAFRIDYTDNQGLTHQATSLYNVTVVPEPVSVTVK